VSSALARIKKHLGRSTTTYEIQVLAGYVKRLAPKPVDSRRVTVEELEREATRLEADAAHAQGAPALLARTRRLLQIIEEERAREPDDADEDHDRFVSVEERLWDLKDRIEKMERP
jgi:hypothetical protein